VKEADRHQWGLGKNFYTNAPFVFEAGAVLNPQVILSDMIEAG
jgi:hypothetical protein